MGLLHLQPGARQPGQLGGQRWQTDQALQQRAAGEPRTQDWSGTPCTEQQQRWPVRWAQQACWKGPGRGSGRTARNVRRGCRSKMRSGSGPVTLHSDRELRVRVRKQAAAAGWLAALWLGGWPREGLGLQATIWQLASMHARLQCRGQPNGQAPAGRQACRRATGGKPAEQAKMGRRAGRREGRARRAWAAHRVSRLCQPPSSQLDGKLPDSCG